VNGPATREKPRNDSVGPHNVSRVIHEPGLRRARRLFSSVSHARNIKKLATKRAESARGVNAEG